MNFKQVANVLGLALLIALVIPFLIYAIPALIGAEYSFIVLSASMEPSISPGDAVIVSETPPEAISVDDTITFTRGDQETPVTHRVVGIESTGSGLLFETKGDNNPDVDASPVPEANVLGVVILTIPYIGYIVQAVNSPVGFALLVVTPILLFVGSELWELLRDSDDAGEQSPEQSAPVSTSQEVDDSNTGDVSLTTGELGLALVVLAFTGPYSVYVAFQLQSTLTISVAFAMVISLIAVAALWLLGRVGTAPDRNIDEENSTPSDDLSEFDPATDGGKSSEEIE